MNAERVGTVIGATIAIALGLGFIFSMGGGGGCDAACAVEQQQRVDDRAEYNRVRDMVREAERYAG